MESPGNGKRPCRTIRPVNGLSVISTQGRHRPDYIFAATADGDTHVVTVDAATSSIFGAGQYDFIGVVAKGSGASAEKHVVFNGVVEMLPNPATAGAYDPRSHSRRVLDLIEAAMEGRIPNGMESYSIGGCSINNIPLNQLRELYEKYKQDVGIEEHCHAGIGLQMKAPENGGRPDTLANDLIEKAWREWGRSDACTVTGRMTWFDVQRLALRSTERNGDCILRMIRDAEGFRLQLLEDDRLDINYNQETAGGNEVRGRDYLNWTRCTSKLYSVSD